MMARVDGYGPWITHDGRCPKLRTGDECILQFDGDSLVRPDPGDFVDWNWPGFYWEVEMKPIRRGLLQRKVWSSVRVCDEPKFQPVIAYAIRQNADLIHRIRKMALDTSAPITGPEYERHHPVKLKPKTERKKNPWT